MQKHRYVVVADRQLVFVGDRCREAVARAKRHDVGQADPTVWKLSLTGVPNEVIEEVLDGRKWVTGYLDLEF